MRDVATLQRIARELRMDIVEMIYRAASGASGRLAVHCGAADHPLF